MKAKFKPIEEMPKGRLCCNTVISIVAKHKDTVFELYGKPFLYKMVCTSCKKTDITEVYHFTKPFHQNIIVDMIDIDEGAK